MKPLVIMIVALLSTQVRADALLNAIYGHYPFLYAPETTKENQYNFEKASDAFDDETPDSEYGNNSEYYTYEGYGEVFEFEDYHLCQYCDTEIVIMNYDGVTFTEYR